MPAADKWGEGDSSIHRQIRSTMKNRFQLTIESRVENLARVCKFVEQTATTFGLDADATYDVQMAVDEAVSNIIEHAYAGKPKGKINLTVEKRGGDLWIEIQDSGALFDPKQVALPRIEAPLSERNIGGLGIFFMRKLMDTVEFSFDPQRGNVLVMTKRIERKQVDKSTRKQVDK
jgi:anti-sigma regulatory factor (Ser/Thr protein kinase)